MITYYKVSIISVKMIFKSFSTEYLIGSFHKMQSYVNEKIIFITSKLSFCAQHWYIERNFIS